MTVITGILAGMLHTLGGVGGGLTLVAVLSFWLSPEPALAITAPALLIGNIHRWYNVRQVTDWPATRSICLGAIPGSFLGGLVASWIPQTALYLFIIAAALFALLKAAGWIRVPVHDRSLVAGGAIAGLVSATASGGGLVFSSILIGRGLRHLRYIATGAAVGAAVNIGRIAAYATDHWFTKETLSQSVVLTIALIFGNLLGHRVRLHMPETSSTRLTLTSLVIAVLFALAGAFLREHR